MCVCVLPGAEWRSRRVSLHRCWVEECRPWDGERQPQTTGKTGTARQEGDDNIPTGLLTHLCLCFQICYGIIYGMGAKSLGEQMGVEENDAACYIESFKARYKGTLYTTLSHSLLPGPRYIYIYIYILFVCIMCIGGSISIFTRFLHTQAVVYNVSCFALCCSFKSFL